MARTTYDPFTWRLAELEALAAQPGGGDPGRRRQLEDDLLVAEAEELAHGRRHLAISHRAPRRLGDTLEPDAFHAVILEAAESAEWHRVVVAGELLFITIAEAGAARAERALLALGAVPVLGRQSAA